MKFQYLALGLVAATAVLADTVKLEGDCKTEFDKFEKCGNTAAAKYDDFLKIYQSDECQNLYKDPLAALNKKCDSLDQETKDKLIADVKFSQAYNILYAAKDDKGNFCPLYKNNSVDKVKDTCGNKACLDASIKAYELFAEGKKLNKNKESTIERYNSILKGLKECGGAAADGKTDATVAGNSTVADAANNSTTAANNSTNAVNGTNASADSTANVAQSGAEEIVKYTALMLVALIYVLF